MPTADEPQNCDHGDDAQLSQQKKNSAPTECDAMRESDQTLHMFSPRVVSLAKKLRVAGHAMQHETRPNIFDKIYRTGNRAKRVPGVDLGPTVALHTGYVAYRGEGRLSPYHPLYD